MRLLANGLLATCPEGWDDRSILTLVAPTTRDGFVANIVVTRERAGAGVTVESFARAQLQALVEQVGALEVLDERGVTIDGAPAYQVLHRWSLPDRAVQQAQTYVLSRGTIFVVTCTASAADFGDHVAAFAELTKSLRFFDPEAVVLPPRS